jgi:hypothetical protein
MLRLTPPSHQFGNLSDLKTLTNFISLAYQGTLAQWQEYLANPELLPAAVKNLALHFDYGQDLTYRSQRFVFSYAPALQAIDKNSLLTLGMSYFDDNGQVAWDVSRVAAKADANNANGIDITRRVAPSDDLDDDYRNEWNKLLHRSHPYDDKPYSKGDTTVITTVGGAPAAADAKPDLLYQISYIADGPQPSGVMKGKLDLLLGRMRIDER